MTDTTVVTPSGSSARTIAGVLAILALILGTAYLSEVMRPKPALLPTVPETWFVHSGTPLIGLHGPKGAPVFMHLFTSERAMYIALGVNPKKVDGYLKYIHKLHTPSYLGGEPVLETVPGDPFAPYKNAYLNFRRDAKWAWGLPLGTSFFSTKAYASLHAHGISAGAPVNPCLAYPNDNGCANAQPGVVGFTPGAQDTNFAYDVAQVGQVLPTANPGFAASLAAYTAMLHTVGDNEPYWDYKIGSSCNTSPGSCANINTFVSDGFCKWWAGTDTGGPVYATNPWVLHVTDYLYCREQGGFPGLNYVAANWDMTNSGTTVLTGLYIFPFNSHAHTITYRNFYDACTGTCPNTATAQGGLVYTAAASGATIPTYTEFDFWTVDGGSPSSTGVPYPQSNYFYKDGMSRNVGLTITYSLFKNLAGDVAESGTGQTAGDIIINYSVCFDCATNGAHGEWTEMTGVNFAQNVNHTGNIWFFASNYCAPGGCTSGSQKKDMTSPIYDSGHANGIQNNNFIIHHNMNVLSAANCFTTGGGVPPYNPDNVASNCGGGGDGSWFELNNTTRVQTIDLAGNFVDREIGDLGCYRTGYGPQGVLGWQAGSSVSVSLGNTITITGVPIADGQTNSPGNTTQMMFPGAWLHSFAHNVSFTGVINNGSGGAGNTLTVSGLAAFSYVIPGQTTISGSGFTSALVTAQNSGTTNGNGTYTINGSAQNVSSRTMTGDDGFTDARMLSVAGVPEVGAGTWNPNALFTGTTTSGSGTLTMTVPSSISVISGSNLWPVDSNGIGPTGSSRGIINGNQTGNIVNITSGVSFTGAMANGNATATCVPGAQPNCGTAVLATGGEPTLAARDGQTWADYTSFNTITVAGGDGSYWYSKGLGQLTAALVTFSGLNSPVASCN